MNTWKPDSFTAKELENKISQGKIIVPKFQRGLVWSEKQKETLIDSIKRGLPFGTLLLFRNADQGIDQIIDGLQRCSTIFEFMRNPAKYFSETDLSDDVFTKIHKILDLAGNKNEIEQEIKNQLLLWITTNHKSMQDVERMQYYDFALVLGKQFPVAQGKESAIVECVRPYLEQYQKICSQLMNIQIPALVIEGDEDILPEVFERINSQGTKLTKYQIYAATWIGDKYSITNDLIDIVKKNRDRYENMLNGMMELDEFDSQDFMKDKKLSVFELAYGFGKLIAERYPALFEHDAASIEVDGIGFTLFNACLGGKSIDLKNLNTRFRNLIPDNKLLNTFTLKLLSCIDYVDKLLGKYNKFKGNSQKRTTLRPLHSELQIASIISYVFVNKYVEIGFNENGNVIKYELNFLNTNDKWKKNENIFKENIAKIYVMEILQQRWSGSGDKKLDNIMTNLSYYTRIITKDEFLNTLQNWFETNKSERKEYKKISTPKESEKLLMNLIYINEFSANEHLNSSSFDIEHLATKNLLKNQLDRFEGNLRLPISSIGNLCLLPQKDNRSKRDKTIYGDTEYLKKSQLTIEDIETRFSFTCKEDLEWINDFSLTETELLKNYYSFIDKRFDSMKSKIINNFIFN